VLNMFLALWFLLLSCYSFYVTSLSTGQSNPRDIAKQEETRFHFFQGWWHAATLLVALSFVLISVSDMRLVAFRQRGKAASIATGFAIALSFLQLVFVRVHLKAFRRPEDVWYSKLNTAVG